MTGPRVLGLDLSITATGIAFNNPSPERAETMTVKTRRKGDARLLEIRTAVRELAAGTALAVIEAPTARSAASVISGMVHGVVRAELIEAGVPYGTMMPNSLKKFATGKGTGDKIPMALEAYKRAGLSFPDDNQCDAWWLWVAGMTHLGRPPFPLPQVNLTSLATLRMEG